MSPGQTSGARPDTLTVRRLKNSLQKLAPCEKVVRYSPLLLGLEEEEKTGLKTGAVLTLQRHQRSTL